MPVSASCSRQQSARYKFRIRDRTKYIYEKPNNHIRMNPELFIQFLQNAFNFFSSPHFFQLSATTGASFALIVAAEIGDKSQLVCITLASRHRALPIILGASAAFIFLNTLAVVFGTTIANWLPDYLLEAVVCLLFSLFGLHALCIHDDNEVDALIKKTSHGIFFSTFLLISVAEFGDKTQLAVVAFSSTSNPYAVWIGATAALIFTSVLGVMAGRTLLKKIPLRLIHKISGIIFLCLAFFAGISAFNSYMVSVHLLL